MELDEIRETVTNLITEMDPERAKDESVLSTNVNRVMNIAWSMNEIDPIMMIWLDVIEGESQSITIESVDMIVEVYLKL